VNNRAPVVFGDGNQLRDFIYIDDAVNAIIKIAENSEKKIVDIGSGISVSFNEILNTIYTVVEKENNAIYIPKPNAYVDKTYANIDEMSKYHSPQVDLLSGLKNILNCFK
jgi:UDP-glucose 4-epimerase